MEEKEKKNPCIPPWKVWILVIIVIQTLISIQNYWLHQQMWNAQIRQGQNFNQYIEEQNQAMHRRLQSEKEMLEKHQKLQEILHQYLDTD